VIFCQVISSRILEQSPNGTKSVFENRGSISISGSGGASLSSGIAVVEGEDLTGLQGIRAYTDLVKNKGAISVSGGQGNTGIFLKVRDNDDISNIAGGTISVSGNRNIGMRVDLGKVITDNAAGGSPKAINNGKIIVGNGEQNIGMVANNSETSGIKAIATNNGTIEFVGAAYKAIGLFAQDGAEMYRQLNSETVNLIVLDINLPGKNGLLLGRELREKAAIPLIFLTGRDNEVDKILGLEIGADDYLTKPFNPRELTIRARNLLHRTMTLNGKETHLQRENYRFNGWTLDLNSHNLITPEGVEFKLPRSEFRAMLHFCENPGKLQTREELLLKMTGRELKPQDRTVDVTIRRIRKHFEDHPNTPEIIATVHGEGYRFCGELEE